VKTELPDFVQIEPVGQCNLRCTMCAVQYRGDGLPGRPAFIDYETFVRLLDQLPNVRELQLQGLGEPLMHPRFFDMVSLATARGIRVSTNTNLTLLNASRAEKCVTSGLDEIHVSIDGATAQTYERIRVRARFERVLRNLDHLMLARRRFASATPSVRWVVVVMRENLHELADVVRLAHRHGVDRIFVQHLSHGFEEPQLPQRYQPLRELVRAQSLLGEEPETVERCFAAAQQTANELGVELRLPSIRPFEHPVEARGSERCSWPWRGAYVTWDGRALPCCMVSTPDRVELGNMAESGVEAVWNGAPFQAFRAQLSDADPPDVCRSCSIYTRTF
jgi:radical SAM protein with 4Fe4S-binding SPASM domain